MKLNISHEAKISLYDGSYLITRGRRAKTKIHRIDATRDRTGEHFTELKTARHDRSIFHCGISNNSKGFRQEEGEGNDGEGRKGRFGTRARARSHCLPDLTLPIFRIGRKTTRCT